ncbi:uncharacterized protein LOC117217550 [Megalopta genalis]|uniref:uncharacterized protein LOC117217550 n=1 Tax=Megalopta genalis TaxID=115081 RepID=UPI003FD0064A
MFKFKFLSDEIIDVYAENEIPKQSKVDQLNISNAEGEFNIKIEEHLESNEYVHEERQSQVDQLNISNTEGEFNIKIEEHLENNEYVHEERQTSGIPVVPFYKTLANLDLEALNLHIIHQKVLQT